MPEPRPAARARRPELEELLVSMRRALVARDEAPGGDWVERAAAELAAGTRPGWYLPVVDGGGVAFFTGRGSSGFGHVHVEPGPRAAERTVALARALLDGLPETLHSIDLGFTGAGTEEEGRAVAELARRPGSTPIAREGLERTLGPEDAGHPGEPPAPLARRPLRDVTVEALADLDRRAFAGTIDALLVGNTTSDYARALEAMLDDQLGRFLDEASVAVLEHDPTRVVGALFTAERSPRRAVFLDLVVDPERRGRGTGRFLLGWGLRALWALGYERAGLWVTSANAPARALYSSFGFRTVGRATIYRWDRPSSSGQPHSAR